MATLRLVFLLCLTTQRSFGGVASPEHGSHSHSHKERESDGAHSPSNEREKTRSSFDHEAVLGSVKEAREFEDLSPEDAKERLYILLTKMDRNDNKVIETFELKSWITRSFSSLSHEDAKEHFLEIDGNRDQKISWNEILKEEFDIENGNYTGDEDEEDLRMILEDHYLFRAADSSGTGHLSESDFFAFSHPEEVPRMKDAIVKLLLLEKDYNQNDKIEFKEYIGDRGSDMSKETLEEEKERFDVELDKNGDGALSREEIIGWMIPNHEDIAQDETNHLFAGSDDDHNGVLSFDEVLSHHELFVGSEATDYGDHLMNIERFVDEL